jgi:CO/xanthine dehydrogenase Mo-binding subunit
MVRGEVIGVGSMRREYLPEHPLGETASFYEFSCTASEVAVDQETGEILLVRHVTVADVGKAINPQQVEGQDEGAAVMGLGHTLMEHLILDERGRIRNLGALDYRIPTSNDLPLEMSSLLVENADGPGPYGAKGAGEGGLMATSPAVASAVAEATGVVIRELPLTPERVWQEIQRHKNGNPSEDAER